MKKGLVWLRRDLRLWDNNALATATSECDEVDVVFVFDDKILEKLPSNDHRVEFLHSVLMSLSDKVNILTGDPVKEIPNYIKKNSIDHLYVNRDYESYALKRDKEVEDSLFDLGVNFSSFKDQVLFEKDEVLNGKGEFYKVFTPYKNRYLDILNQNQSILNTFKVNKKKINDAKVNKAKTLKSLGFTNSEIKTPAVDPIKQTKSFINNDIDSYDDNRDFPDLEATSELSVYIRFGLLSIRSLFKRAMDDSSKGRKVWTSELIWRDFYSMLLQADNKIENRPFNSKYDDFKWDKDKKLLELWKEGKTGYPLVDAGMRQLNQTGFMHNRVRMVVASFLTKTMLLSWQEGEAYFAEKLFDYDLASNNGGWQWASSTGCDAAPYFRVFNPYRQSERFDKEGSYIKKYVPELKSLPKKFIHNPSTLTTEQQEEFGVVLDKDYPSASVDYKENREIIIQRFKNHG